MHLLLCERINEANQYTEMLAEAYQSLGIDVIFDVQNFLFSSLVPNFVHVQWPEAIYRWRHKIPNNEIGLRLLEERFSGYKRNNVPIVYTAHNLLPHEIASPFDEAVYSVVHRSADIIVHHGNASVAIVKERFPECKNADHIICPHGPYPFVDVDARQSRKIYDLPPSRYVFLNFGRQRNNKGGELIRSVFKKWKHRDSCLFTIGPKSGGRWMKFIDRLALPKVMNLTQKALIRSGFSFPNRERTFYRQVSHEETPSIMAASDVLFLGHLQGLNSGLLALAVSYGKPVVYPDLGNFREQVAGWPWQEHYQAGDVQSAINALNRMMEKLSSYSPGQIVFDNRQWLEANSWGNHVKIILNALNRLKK